MATVYTCQRCIRQAMPSGRLLPSPTHYRFLYTTQQVLADPPSSHVKKNGVNDDLGPSSTTAPCPSRPSPSDEQGAMTRRLAAAVEEAALESGLGGRRAIEESEFDPDLKASLLAKIAAAQYNPVSITTAGSIPASAGAGTRDHALSQGWHGQEETADAVLRMLDDAKPRLTHGSSQGARARPSQVVDLRPRPRAQMTAGQRAAGARELAAAYVDLEAFVARAGGTSSVGGSSGGQEDATGNSSSSAVGLSDEEKAELRQEFRARFQPAGRAVTAATVSGLANLANQRIEDAIARGQFRNIPRGPGVQRDRRSDNPFIDTTEYIMNKMIQRQDLVPPWIEKQQELMREARIFRTRLRDDWKRHAARSIAAQGGTLEEQIARAEEYARAEALYNQKVSTTSPSSSSSSSSEQLFISPLDPARFDQQSAAPTIGVRPANDESSSSAEVRRPSPFRDPAWEERERSYMTLAIDRLNSMTRSYNLMAPELARKPYFSLDRELRNCFAEVAPDVGHTIRDRAVNTNPRSIFGGAFGKSAGLGAGGPGGEGSDKLVIKEFETPLDSKPKYGLKQLWRDLWNSGDKGTG